ncbi:transposable element Tcb1 transposase [Trichonephila clavipes]|nr:transposable element Tcb1 transposase [Trichonephila clavipes]
MVWSCMSSHSVGRLHIVRGSVKTLDYIEILQNKLLPTARDRLGNQSWIFQDDNAPCHRAKVVLKWLEDHTVNRMNWPGQSPNLNPIESLWFKIGYEISKQKTSNKRELIEALIFSFNHIVTKDLLKWVHYMPKRCRAKHLTEIELQRIALYHSDRTSRTQDCIRYAFLGNKGGKKDKGWWNNRNADETSTEISDEGRGRMYTPGKCPLRKRNLNSPKNSPSINWGGQGSIPSGKGVGGIKIETKLDRTNMTGGQGGFKFRGCWVRWQATLLYG